MVFEIIEKQGAGAYGIEHNQVSVGKNSFTLGKDFADVISDQTHVQIYIDRDTNRIGFKATADKETGFKLAPLKHGMTVNCKPIAKLVGKGKYNMVREDNMFVIDVPEIIGATTVVA